MAPQSAQAYLELGRIYYQQGDYSHARQEFSTILKIDPYNQQAKGYLKQIR